MPGIMLAALRLKMAVKSSPALLQAVVWGNVHVRYGDVSKLLIRESSRPILVINMTKLGVSELTS